MRSSDPQSQGPGPSGGFPVDTPPQSDGKEATTALLVGQVVQGIRRLSMMYPAASTDLNAMLSGMSRVQQKIVNSKPAPEAAAPPI